MDRCGSKAMLQGGIINMIKNQNQQIKCAVIWSQNKSSRYSDDRRPRIAIAKHSLGWSDSKVCHQYPCFLNQSVGHPSSHQPLKGYLVFSNHMWNVQISPNVKYLWQSGFLLVTNQQNVLRTAVTLSAAFKCTLNSHKSKLVAFRSFTETQFF